MTRKERDARYNHSEKGRVRHQRYNASEKGVKRHREYYDRLYPLTREGFEKLTPDQKLARVRRTQTDWQLYHRKKRERLARERLAREEAA